MDFSEFKLLPQAFEIGSTENAHSAIYLTEQQARRVIKKLVVVKEFTLNRCPSLKAGQMMTPDRETCCGVISQRDP
jgi:hypothetical protein